MPHTDDWRRLRNRVQTNQGPAGCWLWTGGKNSNGYGSVVWFGSRVGAHRAVYSALVRPLSTSEVLDHLCREPLCVNPLHLDVVTLAENIRRGNAGQHNARKTYCKRSHLLDEANVYVNKRGSRECKACRRLRQ